MKLHCLSSACSYTLRQIKDLNISAIVEGALCVMAFWLIFRTTQWGRTCQVLCKWEMDLLQGTWQVSGKGRIRTRVTAGFLDHTSLAPLYLSISWVLAIMSQCTLWPIVSWLFPCCEERSLLRQSAHCCFYVANKMFSLSVLFWQLLVTKLTREVNNKDLRLTVKF